MELDGVHIFIILMLALMCSSCLGSFMREGYENSNGNKYPDNEDDDGQGGTDPKSDKFVRKPVGETYQDGYSDYYRDLDQETVEYSDSKLAKNKRMKPHRSKEDYNDDDNEDNNINSYGNVNKYPNVENDNILTAGRSNGKNNGSSNGSSNGSNNSVSSSQIPPGDEDLYILKSQVVPPVCPACPAVVACPSDNKKCPPCPPCARCPEPAFECKKVPNYSGQNDSYLPQPVMSDFSQFGL
jgi:hypothetical protein